MNRPTNSIELTNASHEAAGSRLRSIVVAVGVGVGSLALPAVVSGCATVERFQNGVMADACDTGGERNAGCESGY